MSDMSVRQESFLMPGYQDGRIREKVHHLIWRLIAPLPDKLYLTLKYRIIKGVWPNIDNPATFSEKVQYRKLHDRDPLYAVLVDKAGAKAYIDGKLGAPYAVPAYWVGTDLSKVDWAKVTLPAVVKPTHASAQGRFLYDQADIDALIAENPLPGWLALDHAHYNREWAYSQVRPQVVIEKMLSVDGGVPWDYRCFTFGGRVFCIQLDIRHEGKGYSCFYSRDWEPMPFLDADYLPPFPGTLPRPQRLDEMISVAERLGEDMDFVRVDLYASAEWVHVGELTLYPGGGFENYEPARYDRILGDQWTLKNRA
ncbi:polysaccharide biosynthesis protein [Rhizobiaceae bacterium BDR2-2]|uniref:Polysaccharide biosynthesis protein n=1 Tax=Ectorhizobium quercum TaxID=2965071 RepID=A0AAE3MW97_9HYPH|nr:ATP-grasp fold amidoligase family protein [Ectorhizobium quercum]MCX8995571.1 polysaccharide biosynthesis protein [Ectorhizobium quercum]